MKNWIIFKQEKEYQKLFASGVINGIGNRFTQVALLALIYQLTQAGWAIGLLFFIRLMPFLIIAPIGGLLADRYRKRDILILVEISRIPIVLMLLFADSLWMIYLCSFALALGEAVYAPTRRAAIPELVNQDRLLYANAIEQIIIGVVLIVGSTTGGLISYFLGIELGFILNGVTFGLSALFLTKIRHKTENTITSKPKLSTSVSYRSFFQSKILLIFLFISLTLPIANGIDNVLLSIYALDVFKMGELGVGLIYGCLGIGFVLSSFFSDWLKKNLTQILVIFVVLEGIGHIFLSISPTFLLALAAVILVTFAGGIGDISLNTMVMKTVPKSKQGTFFGLTEMISNVTLGVFIGIGGILLEFIPPRDLGMIVGVLYIGFALIYGILFYNIKYISEKRKLKHILE